MARGRRWLLILAFLAVAVGCSWWAARPWFWKWRARVAIGRRNWDAAQSHLRWLLAQRPQDTSVRLLMAEALSARGDFHAALSQLELAGNDRQLTSQVARRQGELLLLLDRASQAESSFKQCLSLAPPTAEESIVSRLLLVKAYRWQGRQFEAQSLLEQLYRESQETHDWQTSVMVLMQMFLVDYGEYEPPEVIRRLRLFVANDPQFVAARVALARQEFPNGNLEAAAQELESCLRVAPNNVECREALLEYGLNIAGADPDSVQPILDDWPRDRRGFQFYRRLGELRFKQGRAEEAFHAFSQSAVLRPDTPGVHHQLGTVLVRLGRGEEATLEFRRSAELTKLLDYERVKQLFESVPQRVQAGKTTPADKAVFQEIALFFDAIGRTEVAQRWLNAAGRL